MSTRTSRRDATSYTARLHRRTAEPVTVRARPAVLNSGHLAVLLALVAEAGHLTATLVEWPASVPRGVFHVVAAAVLGLVAVGVRWGSTGREGDAGIAVALAIPAAWLAAALVGRGPYRDYPVPAAVALTTCELGVAGLLMVHRRQAGGTRPRRPASGRSHDKSRFAVNLRTMIVRALLAGTVAAVLTLAAAAPAVAHVDVSADKTEAGAADVVVSFTAESESRTAGIISLQVALPAGIAPADVTLVSGPAGWTLTPQDDGCTVAGPPVPAGQDAEYKVRIAKLPPGATTVAFKTLQSYEDGRIDRWIALAEGGTEPDNPAPALTLTPVAAPVDAATTAPPTTSAPAGHGAWCASG